MQDQIRFLEDFLDAEYDAVYAFHDAEDEVELARLVAAVDARRRVTTIGFDLCRRHGLALARYRARLDRLAPRTVFAWTRHEHPSWPDLVGCLVSGYRIPLFGSSPSEWLFCAGAGPDCALIASMGACPDCRADAWACQWCCRVCGGQGWLRGAGVDLGPVWPPAEVRRLSAPTDAEFMGWYEALSVT